MFQVKNLIDDDNMNTWRTLTYNSRERKYFVQVKVEPDEEQRAWQSLTSDREKYAYLVGGAQARNVSRYDFTCN